MHAPDVAVVTAAARSAELATSMTVVQLTPSVHDDPAQTAALGTPTHAPSMVAGQVPFPPAEPDDPELLLQPTTTTNEPKSSPATRMFLPNEMRVKVYRRFVRTARRRCRFVGAIGPRLEVDDRIAEPRSSRDGRKSHRARRAGVRAPRRRRRVRFLLVGRRHERDAGRSGRIRRTRR